MDSIAAVEKELDKLLSKMNGIHDHYDQTLSDLVDHILAIKNDLDSSPPGHILTPEQVQIVRDTATKVKEAVQSLATDHRELHNPVSRVGKAIDRNFVADIASTSQEDVLDGPRERRLMNEVIRDHFYREGYFDLAQKFCEEAKVQPELLLDDHIDLHSQLRCLRAKNLGPPMEWVKSHRKRLAFYDSELEWKINKLYFLTLIEEGDKNQFEALQFARDNFPQFSEKYMSEVQTLMGMLVFLPKGPLSATPYKDYDIETLWTDIVEVFERDAARVMGLDVESPLNVIINAGCTAVPAIHTIQQVMNQKQAEGDNLPIDVDLGMAGQFHSVFACPILKQQSSEFNPPMRLVCGHVISRDALSKLTIVNKMKCPYCPMEQNPDDARGVVQWVSFAKQWYCYYLRHRHRHTKR